jgi:hypothetical protein
MRADDAVRESRIGVAVYWEETGNNDLPHLTASGGMGRSAVEDLLVEHGLVERFNLNVTGRGSYRLLFMDLAAARFREWKWKPVLPKSAVDKLAELA